MITATNGITSLAATAANTDILLNTEPNDFGTTAWVFNGTTANVRDVAIRNINAGAVLPSFSGLTSLRNLTVDFDSAQIILPTIALTQDLTLATSNAITQVGAISGSTLNATSSNNNGSAITLTNNANDFATINLNTLTTSNLADALGAISYSNAVGFNVADINTSSSVNLTSGGAITQSGAINGSVLTTSSVGGTALSSSNAVNTFNATNTGSGNIQLLNTADTLTITGITQSSNGSVSVTNTGAMTTSGMISTLGGDVDLSTLSPDSNARTLTINGNITTGSVSVPGGSIDLTAANNSSGTATALVVNNTLDTTSGSGGVETIGGGLTLNASPNIGAGNVILQGNGSNLTLSGTLNFTTPTTFDVNGTIDLGANITTNGNALSFSTPVNVFAPSSINAGNGAITFANTVTGAGQTLSLQNNTSANGTVSFDNNVTLAGITTFAQPYAVIFNGATNTFTNAVTFNNTGGVTLGNGASTFNFDAGLTSTASTTTLAGVVNTNNAPLTLGGVTLASDSTLNSAGGPINLGTVNSHVAGTNNLALNAGTGTVNLNGVIGGTASFDNLTAAGNAIDINTTNVSTSGEQTYDAPVAFNTDTTLVGQGIAFNDGISAANNLSLIGQTGNDSFTLTGPLSFNNMTITGSANGNNTLAVNAGNFESWLIAGSNQGNLTAAGSAGNTTFTNIQNITGGNNGNTFTFNDGASVNGLINGGDLSNTNTLNYNSYLTPITATLANTFYSGSIQNSTGSSITNFSNINNLIGSGGTLQLGAKFSTLTFNTAISGFVNDPLNFNQFNSFATLNSADPVVFNAPAIFNQATNQLTIDGVPVQISGFNPASFRGNISIINSPTPGPGPSPIILPSSDVAAILTLQPINYNYVTNNDDDLGITIKDFMDKENVTVTAVKLNGVTIQLIIGSSKTLKKGLL